MKVSVVIEIYEDINIVETIAKNYQMEKLCYLKNQLRNNRY